MELHLCKVEKLDVSIRLLLQIWSHTYEYNYLEQAYCQHNYRHTFCYHIYFTNAWNFVTTNEILSESIYELVMKYRGSSHNALEF